MKIDELDKNYKNLRIKQINVICDRLLMKRKDLQIIRNISQQKPELGFPLIMFKISIDAGFAVYYARIE